MNRMRYALFLGAVGLGLAAMAQGQPSAFPPNLLTEPPAVQSDDGRSPEAIIAALYDVISGPAGKKRNWDRLRSLFAPEARMGLTAKRSDGTVAKRIFTVEDYIAQNGKALEERGFFEREIVKHMDRFGNMAQVFSSYEARQKEDDAKPFMRGINSLLLWNDGKRWWILNVFWQAEGPDNPLPSEYARGGSTAKQ